jgi:hypothetical protein
MEDLHQYRQPMVTATGIFLGFLLNTTNTWIKDAFTTHMFRDVVIGIGITASLALLLLTLVRILRIKYPTEPARFYRKTLVFFFIGITIPFVAFVIIMIEKLISNISSA